MQNQKTINSKISCTGVGLHSGQKVQLSLHPAPCDYGIKFIRTDILHDNIIEANYKNVFKTQLGTTITNDKKIEVSTVEHIMAALWGSSIDNARIEINGPEVPIMDGSSEQFIFMIECAGIRKLELPKQFIEITQEIQINDGDSYAILKPCENFIVNATIDFNDHLITSQRFNFESNSQSFKHELSKARTFGFIQDAEKLKQAGLARGASLDNVIVIDGDKILNNGGLRYYNEFIRHKILDLIGDFYLAGAQIKAEIEIFKPGHTINNKILRTVLNNDIAWRISV